MNAWDRFMTWLSLEAAFLVAIVGGAVLKIGLSADLTWRQRAFTGLVAVWAAAIFSDPALRLFSLDPTYKAPLAAVIALTFEGIARFVLNLVSERVTLLEVIRAWRGK